MRYYIESNDNKYPALEDGFTALGACKDFSLEHKMLSDVTKIPLDNATLIGSVEWTESYFKYNNIQIPPPMDVTNCDHLFTKRKMTKMGSEEFMESNTTWPIFIKPLDKVKDFYATQVKDKLDAHIVLNSTISGDGYNGLLSVQEVLPPFISEWRVYINRKRILACKHYLGDSLTFPDAKLIRETFFHFATESIYKDWLSYTLDFGVYENKNGELETCLIEANDGWAIGCYGLFPKMYLDFCADRFSQIK